MIGGLQASCVDHGPGSGRKEMDEVDFISPEKESLGLQE
jgi:hypothetical protein